MNACIKLLEFMNCPSDLAKLDSFALFKQANHMVEAALRFCEESDANVANVKGKIVEVEKKAAIEGSTEQLREKLMNLQEELKLAIAVRDQAVQAFEAHMDEQKSLFESSGLEPYRRFKEMIIPIGGKWKRIIKRKTNLEPIDMEDDDHKLSIVASRSYSSTVNIRRDQGRGKYNDGHMLINMQAASIDPSEVVPFAMPCC